MTYTVYILQSEATFRYYVGHTDDVPKRLIQHNSGVNKSTRNGVPWKLIYTEVFNTRSEAMKRELQIKKRGIERFLRDTAQPG